MFLIYSGIRFFTDFLTNETIQQFIINIPFSYTYRKVSFQQQTSILLLYLSYNFYGSFNKKSTKVCKVIDYLCNSNEHFNIQKIIIYLCIIISYVQIPVSETSSDASSLF